MGSSDATTGALTFVEVHKNVVGGVDGLDGADSVTVSPDGKHLYVAGFDDDAVAVFSVPSVSQWGLIALMGAMAVLLLWRRRRAVSR